MTQAQANEVMAKKADQFIRTQYPRITNEALRKIMDSRFLVYELLEKYAKNDDTISKARLNSLVRELESIENETRRIAEQAITQAVTTGASYGAYAVNTALIVGIGAATLAGLLGGPITAAQLTAQASAAFTEFALLAIGGITFETIRRATKSYVFNNVGNDGKTLSDRVWQYAGDLRGKVAEAIRKGVLKGRKRTQIQEDVGKVYEAEKWKPVRLVSTEVLTAYRRSIAEVAKRSPQVSGLKIVDHPDGHGHHETHECYIYAREKTQLGVGVFPVTETKILQPHPQCESTLELVLTTEIETGGADDNA